MTKVPLLEAERLTVRRAGRAVLDDVSMAVAGGDMVALYGPSGRAAAGSSSAWRWPARWRAARTCCWSTSRPRSGENRLPLCIRRSPGRPVPVRRP
jgi:hypothetical protein